MTKTPSNIPNRFLPPLLAHYKSMADGIAMLLFPYVEVVIHDLGTRKVAYLANNLSKREPGDDSTLNDIEFDASENVIGPYEKLNWDGRKIRSVSVVLRDDTARPIGMLCVNVDISVFEHTKAALDLFLTGIKVQPQPEKLFRNDWLERINTFLHGWMQERQLGLTVLTRDHKRQLIEALYATGAFDGKNSVEHVANVLSMGRATVFKYLKELKESGQ